MEPAADQLFVAGLQLGGRGFGERFEHLRGGHGVVAIDAVGDEHVTTGEQYGGVSEAALQHGTDGSSTFDILSASYYPGVAKRVFVHGGELVLVTGVSMGQLQVRILAP